MSAPPTNPNQGQNAAKTSGDDGNNPAPTQPAAKGSSPGKGGKSLQLMQQRLMPQQQPPPQQQQQQTQAPSQPAQQQGRPKGKDFSAMSARAPPPMPAPAAAPATSSSPQGGKPKGKDFSAMASRMAPSPSSQQQQPPVRQPTQAERERAASLHESARRHAGLPPQDPSLLRGYEERRATPRSTVATAQPSAMESRLSIAGPHMAPLVGPRIQKLLQEVDPNFTLDSQAEQQVLLLVDDFLDKVCKHSVRLAQHRASKTVDVQDVQMVLAKQWDIVIPGLGPPDRPAAVLSNAKRKSPTAITSGSVSASNKASKLTSTSTPGGALAMDPKGTTSSA